jgi:hypothetical protein
MNQPHPLPIIQPNQQPIILPNQPPKGKSIKINSNDKYFLNFVVNLNMNLLPDE